ncbi:uncharacterized protein BXZ73DRAFT_99692 [Epithele typhae]|uniref:uncharacterized protein n=1 Tax=Epithele typhae TaxID=378194 RepID=UPI002008C722|nr:uncharacterized protein BXZ73DRAFT_99692 [Epithele typhae]KAH9939017.1 hypothetical protein BXZ73DRAFT_99692 [Epithele typhae]
MPRATAAATRARARVWSSRSSASSEDEDRLNAEIEYESSELSELDNDSDYTPESEDEGRTPDNYESHHYQVRDPVWVKPKGCPEWYRGRVVKVQPVSRESRKRGPLYLVVFRRQYTNMRDCFAPREGTIRPDSPRVRALIFNSGS